MLVACDVQIVYTFNNTGIYYYIPKPQSSPVPIYGKDAQG